MPPIRTHDFVEMEDDDGMPPLVDNPNPHPSMSFTFFTDMTPITTTEPTIFEMAPETSILACPDDSAAFYDGPLPPAPVTGDGRSSHGKKRDASYIPRPPNAFILFRSSFIRSQQVPGKVEGNHSTLSKIIGMYWKTLPREEREVWEAKALVAQAEHRKRYPDWRFRPGANALAKLKVKDGPGTSKRRNSNSGGSTRKSKGDTAEVKEKSDEKRCAKIADFLVEGKKGVDLEAALKEWEGSVGKGTKVKECKSEQVKGGSKNQRGRLAQSNRAGQDEAIVAVQPATPNAADDITPAFAADTTAVADMPLKASSLTPNDHRFTVPLTAMFKRALSAPASQTRSAGQLEAEALYSTRRASSASATSPSAASQQQLQMPSPFAYQATSISLSPQAHEAIPRAAVAAVGGNEEMASDCLSPLMLSPVFERDTLAAHWSDPFDFPMSATATADPDTPNFGYDSTSPAPSPVLDMLNHFSIPSPTLDGLGNTKSDQVAHTMMNMEDDRIYNQGYTTYDSTFSTLHGWAGDVAVKDMCPRISGESIAPYSMDAVVGGYEWPQGQYGEPLSQYSAGLGAFNFDGSIGVA